ncbi:MAG: hypothetical protein KC613_10665, partial [Myxococcales bacterium]|nr:hypothetical protein [Myxococcales bacterium]
CNEVDDDCDGVVDPAPVCATFASCKAAAAAGHTASGVFRLQPGPGLAVFEVWCDQATDGGGWTLVGSIAGRALDDRRSAWYPDLATLAPQGQDAGVWHGLRALDSRFDVRFACRASPGAADAPFTVDLSMYDTGWYTEWTTGSDGASCFSEGNGAGADLPPARRNNLSGQYLTQGTQWRAGYLEGEDQCGATEDFTVDFADRGMDGDPNDGTDWGEDDGALKCGRAGLADGQWFLFAREAGRLLRQGAYRVSDGPSWVGHESVSCIDACEARYGAAEWACSRAAAAPDRRAWLDGWGDVATFCGPASEGAPEAFVAPDDGPYDCGAAGCSYSAFVDDHDCDRQNHCWRRVAPLAFVPPAAGSGGTLGRLDGDPWRVCAADDATAWVAADRQGRYAPTTVCRALGYAEADAWGGHCGQVCGQCPGGPRYDGVGGDAVRLTGLVHWRCRR